MHLLQVFAGGRGFARLLWRLLVDRSVANRLTANHKWAGQSVDRKTTPTVERSSLKKRKKKKQNRERQCSCALPAFLWRQKKTGPSSYCCTVFLVPCQCIMTRQLMCAVFLAWATIPKYQRQKLNALVNVALYYRVEDKHKGKITFTGGKHDTGASISIWGTFF